MRINPIGYRAGVILASTLGGVLTLLALAPGNSQGQEPARRESGGVPARLARYAPREDLVGFFEFDGLGAHDARWRKSALYKVLHETKMGPLIEDLLAQGLRASLDAAPGPDNPTAGQIIGAMKAVARDGFVASAAGEDPKRTRAILALRGGARGAVRSMLDLTLRHAAGGKPPAPETKAGRGVYWLGKGRGDTDPICLFEGADAVFTSADNVEAMAELLSGRRPSAADHPVRAELMKPQAGFEPIARGFVDITKFPPMPPEAVALGLDGLKRVDFRWGFQDDALLSVLDIVAPSPRRGVLALVDQPTFDRSSLPPMPEGLTGFTVASFDLARTFDAISALRASSRPGARAGAGVREPGGLVGQIRRDLLPHLGPKVAFYKLPDPNAEANPLVGMLSPLGGLTLTLQADDPAAVGRALGPLAEAANRALKEMKGPRGPRPADAPAPRLLKGEGEPLRYTLDLPPGLVPPGPLSTIRPTLIVGESRVVVSTEPRSAERALAAAGDGAARWAATGAFEPMARRLPSGLIFLSVSDPRATMPNMIAALPSLAQYMNSAIAAQARQRPGGAARPPFALEVDPDKVPSAAELAARLFPSSFAASVDARGLHLVGRESVPSISSPAGAGVMVGLLLPAVQAAREAARRAQCVNNLKQIGLAMHNHHAVYGTFPPAAITDKAGKPLLSWRVAILPFMEQEALYKQFHLDEPWDSPHNKALIASMPMTYACPSRPKGEEGSGLASYRVFTGATTAFPPGEGLRIDDVTDGTSFTLLAVESQEGIPWTKPEELEFDPEAEDAAPNFGAGSYHPGGLNALLIDGSVRFLKLPLDPDFLRALITRAGGEVVEFGQAK